MSTDVKRNYLGEAMAIINGQSHIIAEAEHLRALAGQQESILREQKLLAEILAAILIDTGQSSVYLPSGALENVRTNGFDVRITQSPRQQIGAVQVDLSRRPMAAQAAASKARVN